MLQTVVVIDRNSDQISTEFNVHQIQIRCARIKAHKEINTFGTPKQMNSIFCVNYMQEQVVHDW